MIQWKLKAVMGDRHVKNIQLADALGVDRRVVSRWRHPSYTPQLLNIEYLDGMCKVLKCTPNDLLVYTEPTNDPTP